MVVASVMLTTCTGITEPALLPLPSPKMAMPQQDMVPFRWRAQECPLPAEMAVASVMPRTCTGIDETAFLPLCLLPN